MDGKIISLCARGLTVREIQGHPQELYGTEVSPDLISRVADAVLEEVKAWQARPLDALLPDPWRAPIDWTTAMGQLAVVFGDRFALSAR